MRREIARVAIERLIEDGRVHPARIEEVTVKVAEEVDTMTSEAGEAACLELGLAEVHPRLQRLLGRLKFRTQHGYNLLDHALEVAFLAGYMAAELGGRADVARRAGLLHDVSQTEDVPPPSPAVFASSELVLKFGESDEVAHAIRAIHRSVEPRSLEALLVAAAERIALNRPGARKDNLEVFIERLARLEEIASSFEGVKRSYAVRAGKELRVMVESGLVSDEGVLTLSREIAARIEGEVDYAGQVRIQVIREIRAIDFAV
jgi:ribonuclease Y